MKRLPILFTAAMLAVLSCKKNNTAEAAVPPPAPATEVKKAVLEHSVTNIKGEQQPLSVYKGKVLLIVNTASKCGFTPQYGPLEELYKKYKAKGFEVLAFPSNDFGGQEPLSEPEVESFCSTQYGVTFPLFAKVHAKGPDQSPLYRTLTETPSAEIKGEVRWNFTKFLVDRSGKVVARYEPVVDPLNAKLIADVERLLAEPAK